MNNQALTSRLVIMLGKPNETLGTTVGLEHSPSSFQNCRLAKLHQCWSPCFIKSTEKRFWLSSDKDSNSNVQAQPPTIAFTSTCLTSATNRDTPSCSRVAGPQFCVLPAKPGGFKIRSETWWGDSSIRSKTREPEARGRSQMLKTGIRQSRCWPRSL